MKFIFGLATISLVSILTFADRLPSLNDRYCGTFLVHRFSISNDPRFSHRSPEYFIKVETEHLEINDEEGLRFVDQPRQQLILLDVRRQTFPASEINAQISMLQFSMLSLLTEGGSYCVYGKTGPTQVKNELTPVGINFIKILKWNRE